MKSKFVLTVAWLCLSGALWAAPPGRPAPPTAAKVMDNMNKQLDLTPQQRPQIQQIITTMPPGPGRQAAIMKVLNPQQQAKFRNMLSHVKRK